MGACSSSEEIHGDMAESQMGHPAANRDEDSPQLLGSPNTGMGDEDEFPVASFSDDDGGASLTVSSYYTVVSTWADYQITLITGTALLVVQCS